MCLERALASSLDFDWKPNWFFIKEAIPLWRILLRLIDSMHIVVSLCSPFSCSPSFLFFCSFGLRRSSMVFLNLHSEWSEPSVHGLDYITQCNLTFSQKEIEPLVPYSLSSPLHSSHRIACTVLIPCTNKQTNNNDRRGSSLHTTLKEPIMAP